MTYRTDISVVELREGAQLVTIAHALWVTQYDDFAYEHSWEDSVYNVSNSQGGRGTVAFSESEAVGVFYDAEQARRPADLERLFEGLPAELEDVKREALEYMQQDVGGGSKPVATSGFWSEGGQVVASAPWEDVYRNGAYVLRIHLLELGDALQACKVHYDFTDSQVELVREIHARRTSSEGSVTLTEREADLLTEHGDAGLSRAADLLESIGIQLP